MPIDWEAGPGNTSARDVAEPILLKRTSRQSKVTVGAAVKPRWRAPAILILALGLIGTGCGRVEGLAVR